VLVEQHYLPSFMGSLEISCITLSCLSGVCSVEPFLKAFGKPAIILSCMFPFFMMFVEWLFKIASQTGTGTGAIDFFGPSLAAAGVGFLVPLTTPKPIAALVHIDADKIKQLADAGLTLRNRRDEIFCQFVWVAILIFLCAWMGSLQLSTKYPDAIFMTLPLHIWLGLFNYFIGVICACIKEVM